MRPDLEDQDLGSDRRDGVTPSRD
ncbi:hypothetical protein MTBUT4_550018 [Magnetospirillum sp. UT-4]|nr:hypothetical protein MTBUT4_550018 [Magnetospirillum sp. UT-4]